MAKDKSKRKKRPGRISLKKRLLSRLFWKDQQIAALLRGRDMRDRSIRLMKRKNDMAMRVIAVMLRDHGGIYVLPAEAIAEADINAIGVFEDTLDKAVYIGEDKVLRAVMLRQPEGDSKPLCEAASYEKTGVEDVRGTIAIGPEDAQPCEGDDIDIEAIDDEGTVETVQELRSMEKPVG